jgi:hypothetical protein
VCIKCGAERVRAGGAQAACGNGPRAVYGAAGWMRPCVYGVAIWARGRSWNRKVRVFLKSPM